MKWLAVSIVTTAFSGVLSAQTSAELREQVESLRASDTPWRGLPWKSCLLEGLATAKASGKPLILWIFIDRPVDDARC